MRTPNFGQFIREQYPPGTRLRLESMDDPHHPVPPGTEGFVDFVDDIGQIHMKWDNGRTLALVPGVDRFSVIEQKQELTPLKMYMPLHCSFYTYNRYGGLEDEPETLGGRESLEYADNILAAMERYRDPEERERGLMHYYHEKDTVNDIVHSAEFSVEKHDGSLWGIIKAELKGELDAPGVQTLKDYLTGQASDGWGEGFEQQDIKVQDGVMNAHLWNWGNDWQIMTESEFARRHEQAQAPQMGDVSY